MDQENLGLKSVEAYFWFFCNSLEHITERTEVWKLAEVSLISIFSLEIDLINFIYLLDGIQLERKKIRIQLNGSKNQAKIKRRNDNMRKVINEKLSLHVEIENFCCLIFLARVKCFLLLNPSFFHQKVELI